ncbi:MAG TPA: phosphotransferase [Gemmataceae bacterium]|nr:phosphotransferase [Gemmataceae bacterium]
MTLNPNTALPAYPPALALARWSPLGNAGGFSGARLWRGVAADGREYCLKAHPVGADAGRLERILHPWMIAARGAGLDFVPQVERTRDGRTAIEIAERVWDVCEWMPGMADFHANPTDERLVAAVTALAQLHNAWSRLQPMLPMPCPAIMRRWEAIQEWEKLVASGWRPRPTADDPIAPHANAAWSHLPAWLPKLRAALTPWLNEPVSVQPCLCDVWHDHVLFTGDRVTGLIDFGAAKIDHVAVDLARLLGSLFPEDVKAIDQGVQVYERQRRLSFPELVAVLDWTGTVIGITNWLRWLYLDYRQYSDRKSLAARLLVLQRSLISKMAI